MPNRTPAQAEDLARAHREGDVLERAFAAEAGDLEDGFPRLRPPLRVDGAQRTPDHHLDGAIPVELGGRMHADQVPIAQDRDAVGDPVDLLHPVADEHHGDAPRLQGGDDGEQPLDLALGERRGRLVHDQHLGLDRQRPRDLDELLLGGAQPLQHLLRTARQADDVEQLLRPRPHAGVVDAAEPPARHVAHEDVLEDAEIAEQAGMLVHDRDAAAGRLQRRPGLDRDAVDEHRTAVGPIDAGQQLDAGALAGAVLPQEGKHVPSNEIECPARESDGAPEALRGLPQTGRGKRSVRRLGRRSMAGLGEDRRSAVAERHDLPPCH